MISYDMCKTLKELGYPQKKYRYAKYYISPDIIIDFELAHDMYMANSRKMNDIYDEINWTETLIYIPTLEDLVGETNYDVTLNSAAFAWIDTRGREHNPEELVNRTLDAIKEKDNKLAGEKTDMPSAS